MFFGGELRWTAHSSTLILLFVQASSEWLLTGEKRSAAEDFACSYLDAQKQGTGSDECVKSSAPVTLKPGQAYIVDDFLDATELKLLHQIFSGKAASSFERGDAFKSKWMEARQLPSSLGLDQALDAILRRVVGHANAHLRSNSALDHKAWKYQGEYFMDHWQFRHYNGSKALQPHLDTGLLGRCLSASLHLDDGEFNEGFTLQGGDFKTYNCRSKNCFGYGWQYDRKLPEPTIGTRLDGLATVPYRPGRLTYFLAETIHGVDAVKKGDRNVLFMWHSCSPTLVNGAVRNGHVSNIKYLVERGADVNDRLPETGLNPASVAADSGHTGALEFLLQNGADAKVPDLNGVLPIHRAARAGHLPVLEMLAKSGTDWYTGDKDDKTALVHAVEAGHIEVTQYLAEQAGGLQSSAMTLAEHAVTSGHCPVVDLLRKEGRLDVKTSAAGKNLPLMHRAAAMGHKAVLECLTDSGAEVSEVDSSRGSPPLHPAVAKGSVDVVKFLLSKNASPTTADRDGSTALHHAADSGHLKIINMLLEEVEDTKAILKAKDAGGMTAKKRAKTAGKKEAAKLLGRAGKGAGKDSEKEEL